MANILPNRRNVLVTYDEPEETGMEETIPEDTPVLERQDAEEGYDEYSEEEEEEEEEIEIHEPPKDEDIFNVNQPVNMVPVNPEPAKRGKKKKLSDKQLAHLARIRKLAAAKRKAKKEQKAKEKEEKKKQKAQKAKEKKERSKAWRKKRGLPLEGKIAKQVPVNTEEKVARSKQLYEEGYKKAWGDFMGYMDKYEQIKAERKQNRKYKQNRQANITQKIEKKPVSTNRWDGKLW